jgi:hypothetical protein
MDITRSWAPWATLALLTVAELTVAGASGETSSCPGAAAWRESHRDQLPPAMAQRDEARTFGAPALRAELQRRFEEDQRERQRVLANLKDLNIADDVLRMDANNLVWLRKLVSDSGIPTVAQVGESGVHWAWLLVQHATEDPAFQLSVQPIFAQRQAAGELPADDLARLTDRVLVEAGKPQRFGTQFDWYSGRFKPKGVVDMAEIEANRRQLGLMSLKDYACVMNGKLKRE